MSSSTVILAAVALLGSGLMAGLLFAFSNVVMGALRKLPKEQAAAAMRYVNVEIQNPSFLVLFAGTPLVCIALVWSAVRGVADPSTPWLVAGSIAYVTGPLLVTVLVNVRLNDRLADGPIEDAADAWPAFATVWTRWNHVRTVLAVVATTLLSVGLVKL